MTFPPHHGEKSNFQHTVVKIQIFMTFTTCPSENSSLHHTMVKTHLQHAVVKIHIYTTFTPCPGENSDFHDIYTTLW